MDDADLQALLEDGKAATETCICTTKCAAGAVNTNCLVCKTNMTECTGPEPEETEQPQEDEAKSTGMSSLVVFLVVALMGGGPLISSSLRSPRSTPKVATSWISTILARTRNPQRKKMNDMTYRKAATFLQVAAS